MTTKKERYVVSVAQQEKDAGTSETHILTVDKYCVVRTRIDYLPFCIYVTSDWSLRLYLEWYNLPSKRDSLEWMSVVWQRIWNRANETPRPIIYTRCDEGVPVFRRIFPAAVTVAAASLPEAAR